MPATYELIAKNVLTTTTSSITFSNIPNTYTDLILKISARINNTWNSLPLNIRLNSDSQGVYSMYVLESSGSNVYGTKASNQTQLTGADANGTLGSNNVFSNAEIYIGNYTSTAQKPLAFSSINENNSTSTNVIKLESGNANITSAITSIYIYEGVYNSSFLARSSFYLYGIKKS